MFHITQCCDKIDSLMFWAFVCTDAETSWSISTSKEYFAKAIKRSFHGKEPAGTGVELEGVLKVSLSAAISEVQFK